jgi:hypothetical protein
VILLQHDSAAFVCLPLSVIANEPLDAETNEQEQLQLLEFLDVNEERRLYYEEYIKHLNG